MSESGFDEMQAKLIQIFCCSHTDQVQLNDISPAIIFRLRTITKWNDHTTKKI
jgi:hypothetical protein